MTDTTARGMPGEPRRRPDRHLSVPPAGRRLHGLAGPARAHLTASRLPAWHTQTIKENHRVPSSHLQEMRQDHLGRLRPARQAGDGRRPGLPALRRPRQRPRRQRRLAAQALRPRLNRHRITPAIRTDPWCLRRARATSRIAPSLAGGAAAENYHLEQVLASRTPIVFGMLAALGFILLLVAPGPPPGHNAGTPARTPAARHTTGSPGAGTPDHGRPPRTHRPQAGTAIRWPRAAPPRIPSRGRRSTGVPGPGDVPPAVAATGTTPACCPGPTARCVRRRAAREAPFRNKRRSANAGDAEGDA